MHKNLSGRLFIFLVLFIVSFIMPALASAEEEKSPAPIDIRVLALKYYLQQYDSPLAEHAGLLVSSAEEHKLDWRLVPAIAAVESNFGHKIPGGKDPDYTSHNAWGWGVYGDKVTGFQTWEQGILTVVKGVKERFIDLSTDDYFMVPYKSFIKNKELAGCSYQNMGLPAVSKTNDLCSIKLSTKYSTNPEWTWQVEYFIIELDEYTRAFEAKFGDQIRAYNLGLTQQEKQIEDAKKFVFPPAQISVDSHRLSIF